MTYEDFPLLLSFLLVVATAIFFVLAKRDLNASAAEKHAPTVAELEKVRAIVEGLIDVLEERVVSSERRLSSLVDEAEAILADAAQVKLTRDVSPDATPIEPDRKPTKNRKPAKLEVVDTAPGTDVDAASQGGAAKLHVVGSDSDQRPGSDADVSEHYRQIYALSDSGLDDIVEIARRTGLGQSEVEMVLSLRDRGA